MLEDGAAVAGLAIAGLATAATAATGNVAWDAAGSLAVGALLVAVLALVLDAVFALLIAFALPRGVRAASRRPDRSTRRRRIAPAAA